MFEVILFGLGGIAGRMKGGWPDWLGLPKIVRHLMMAGCYTLALWLAGISILQAILVGGVLSWVGVVISHDAYTGLGVEKDTGFFAPILNIIPCMGEKEDGNMCRDFLGMTLTGVALTGPVSLGLVLVGLPAQYWAVGVCKPFCYWVGRVVQPDDGTRQSPEWVKNWLGVNGSETIGEWLWGAVSVSLLYALL